MFGIRPVGSEHIYSLHVTPHEYKVLRVADNSVVYSLSRQDYQKFFECEQNFLIQIADNDNRINRGILICDHGVYIFDLYYRHDELITRFALDVLTRQPYACSECKRYYLPLENVYVRASSTDADDRPYVNFNLLRPRVQSLLRDGNGIMKQLYV